MKTEDRLTNQEKALEALQESTKTLEIAEQLLSVGNIKEAERLRDKAREQRNISIWLMSQSRDERVGSSAYGSSAGSLNRPRRVTEH